MDTPKQKFLRIKESWSLTTLEDRLAFLVSEGKGGIVNNVQSVALLEKIANGTVSREQLLQEAGRTGDWGQVYYALEQLEANGYITSDPAPFPPEQMAWWQELGYDPVLLKKKFTTHPLMIQGLGGVSLSAFRTVSEATGLRIAAEGKIGVVLTPDYLFPDLEFINREALEKGQVWLLVKLNGGQPLIGPLFGVGHEFPCWDCLRHRLELHNHQEKIFQALSESGDRLRKPLIQHPIAEQIAMNMAVQELVKWIYEGKHDYLQNGLFSMNPRTWERTFHKLLKRPQCTSCGDPDIRMQHPAPIELNSTSQNLTLIGGYRTVSPEETFERFKHHISSLTGVVPYVKPYYPLPGTPVFNFLSGKNMALRSNSMFWMNLHLRSANGGKGKSEIQAKTGALCESIERYCMTYQDRTFGITGTLAEIENAIHPNDCQLYSEQQYKERTQLNAQATKFYSLIPVPFNPDLEMEWTPVYSLSQNTFKYLPSCFCFGQYPNEDEAQQFAYPDSNGCAAGNTIEEAILQAMLELIERDAVAIWWYNRIPRPGVDLDSFANAYIDEVRAYYEEIGRSLYVLDLTTDLKVPVFVAISHKTNRNEKDRIIFGFGAHVDASIAIERSIIELNQMLPAGQPGNYKGPTRDPILINWMEHISLKNQPYLFPKKGDESRQAEDYGELCPASLFDSVSYLIECVEQAGMEVLVHDLTQPDVELPVVRVLIPGIRHMWRRTAPGRLYEVPVKLGWLEQPLSEAELNPISVFILSNYYHEVYLIQ